MKLAICILCVVIVACTFGYGARFVFVPVVQAMHAVVYNLTTDNRGLHD